MPIDKDRSKNQPEALATFAAAERAGGKKPDHVGLTATPDTGPIPTSPKKKDEAATKVLREGVTGRDEGAEEAIEQLPDRVMAHRKG